MDSHAGNKRGRPAKKPKKIPARSLDKNVELQTVNTCFGAVKKNKDGEVLIPRELFEDLEMQFSALSESNIFIILC